MLKSSAMEGLRQKYGPETYQDFWTFDEQGGRPDAAKMRFNNCGGGIMNFSPPDDASNPQPSTPLIYAPSPENNCSNVVSVRVQFGGVTSGAQDMVGSITVFVQDSPLARRSQVAYQAALANAGDVQRKQEIERAKQQKTPTF
jgi:hypothetical protein